MTTPPKPAPTADLVSTGTPRSSITARTPSTDAQRITDAKALSLDDPSLDDKEALKLADGHGEDVVNAPLPGERAERPVIPWKYKLMAWSFIVFWGTGCWLAEQALGPLKATMKRELNITNAQYGAISSSSSFINSVLPIIGGIGMDHFGGGNAAVICSVLMTVGLVVSACAANVGHHGLLIGGRILSGFGSGVLAQTGFKLYAHWFYGSNIALVYGIDIAWNRVITVVARAAAVPMSQINGWWGWALWIPAIIQGACMLLVFGYWTFERSIPKEFRPVTGRDRVQSWGESTLQRAKRMLKSITTLPMLFWVIVVTQIPQNGAAVAFQGNMADMQRVTRGTTELAAGYNTSLQGIIPIVGTPLLGWFIDKYGFRMWFFSWTAILYVVVFALMGLTTIHPLAPILISSVAFVSNILPFMASVPVLVGDDAKLGSALGVFNSMKNANILVLDVLAGVVQDATPGKTYERVIYMLIAIKAIDIFVGPVYDYLDGRWLGHSLRMPEKKRVAFREEALQQKKDLRGWRVERPVFISVALIMTAWVIVGWVLFIVYSIGA